MSCGRKREAAVDQGARHLLVHAFSGAHRPAGRGRAVLERPADDGQLLRGGARRHDAAGAQRRAHGGRRSWRSTAIWTTCPACAFRSTRKSGDLIYGKWRFDLPFEENVIRPAAERSGERWYVLDTRMSFPDAEDIWLRCYISADAAANLNDMSATPAAGAAAGAGGGRRRGRVLHRPPRLPAGHAHRAHGGEHHRRKRPAKAHRACRGRATNSTGSPRCSTTCSTAWSTPLSASGALPRTPRTNCARPWPPSSRRRTSPSPTSPMRRTRKRRCATSACARGRCPRSSAACWR